jgi:hypothetical protein
MAQLSKALVSVCLAGLTGCSIFGANFDKGQALLELSFGKASRLERDVALAEGRADLVIAVRDGKCRPVENETTLDVTLTGMDVSINRSMRMGELTWAYAEGSCDAYGYLYDASVGLSRKFDVRSGTYRLITQVHSGNAAESRTGTLWIIYGGRAPTTRMFSSPPAK